MNEEHKELKVPQPPSYTESYRNPPLMQRQVNRRGLLKIGAAVGIALTLGKGNKNPEIHKLPQSGVKTFVSAIGYDEIEEDPNDPTVNSPGDINTFGSPPSAPARDWAQELAEAPPPPEKIKELPQDEARKADLEKAGIHIVSTSSQVDLLIRRSALEQNTVLNRIYEGNQRFWNPMHPAYTLNIVLTGGERLNKDTVVPDEYRQTFNETIQQLQASKPHMKKGYGGFIIYKQEWKNDREFNLLDRRYNSVLEGPEAVHHSYTIFLPVEGVLLPKEDQSFPGPGQLSSLPIEMATNTRLLRDTIGAEYLPQREPNAGFNLLHELFHVLYAGMIDTDELNVDIGAYKDRVDANLAWRYGDNSKYYFVFVVKRPDGSVYPVYTWNQKQKDQKISV